MPHLAIPSDLAEEVERAVPDASRIREAVLQLHPDMIAARFGPGSRLPEAAVCLMDATCVTEEARYSLVEGLTLFRWYSEFAAPSRPIEACFFGKFYADDAALRLYAAGEHLATACLELFETPYEPKRSRLARVRSVLAPQHPGHRVTLAVMKLIRNDAWTAVRKYRNEWVHEGPPLAKGLGIQFRRGPRWQGDTLLVGMGDEPTVSVPDLLIGTSEALRAFIVSMEAVVLYLQELLS